MYLELKLTKTEINTPLWIKLAKHLAERLETSRELNDGNLSESETSKLRGRISVYKEILTLAKPLTATGPTLD